MNCKQGDLAFIVGSELGNTGKIVKVIRFLGECPYFDSIDWFDGMGPCWLVETQGSQICVQNTAGVNGFHKVCPAPDSRLRPIRPGDVSETTDSDLKLKETA